MHSDNQSRDKETGNHHFISSQLKMLRYLCIWPLHSENHLLVLLHKISAVIRISFMILVSIGQFIQLFFMPNLGLLSSVIDVATLTTSAAFKWIFTIVHVREFDKLNQVIFDRFLEVPLVGSKTSKMSMTSLLKYKDILCYAYCATGTMIMTLWAFTPLLNSFIHDDNPLDRHNSSDDHFLSPYHDLKMPINSWLPFSPTWSPLYQIVFIIEYLTFVESAFVYGFQDGYFFTMLYCVCCQMDILCETMKNIKLNLERMSGEKSSGKLETNLRRVEIKEKDGDREMISNQNQFDTNSYLGLQQSMLRFLSLWPSTTEGLLFKLARSFLLIIRVLLMLIASVGQIVQIYYMPDLGKISNIMDIVTLTTSGSYKAMFVFVRQRDYQNLVNVMQTKFMEKPFFGESKHRRTMRYYLRHTELLSNMYVYSSLIAITLWGLTPLLNNFIEDESINHCTPTYSTLNKNDSSCNTLYKDLKLPINLWLPYDISWFPMYQILFVVVFLPLIDSTLFYIMEDAFFFTMLYSVCGQFDLLKESLENMSQHIVKNERQGNRKSGVNGSHDDYGLNDYTAIDKTQYDEVELHNILKQCIEHHTVLLKFLRDYEKLSQTMIIVDFLHAIISLSFALLEITVSQNIIEYTKMLLFLVICIWHQFLNNHFGELIIQKQMSIADAAYDLPWVERSPQFRTSMKIMIMRAQQPVILNGLKMYFLCYKTFMEFTKALISYFMVLRTLQEGK